MMYKKILFSTLAVALNIVSLPALAKVPDLPAGWKATHPIIIVSKKTHGPGGLSPAAIKKAYNFPTNFQGAGQVIAIVDPYDNPNIEADLNTFSTQFGLPACTTANGCFTKVYASGSKPDGNTSWGTEIALDVEWAHAIAPLAKIMLVEAADEYSGLYDAITVAIKQKATVISLSWGGPEFNGESSYDQYYFASSPVPIVAATGDSGNGVWYPAVSPTVIAAGGTQITLDSNGNYVSETAWSGSGGGLSAYEAEPAFQTSYAIPAANNKRGVPDVAYNASPGTGYSVYDSYGQGGWMLIGGTSASAPQWAALIAIMKGAKKGNFGNFNASIYSVARTAGLLHDVTTGTNGSCGYYCTARSGYDYVTGVGSPQAANLIARFQ